MRPSEFKVTKVEDSSENESTAYVIIFYYEDGSKWEHKLDSLPKDLEVDKHYFLCEY